jgi:hypothetical protein
MSCVILSSTYSLPITRRGFWLTRVSVYWCVGGDGERVPSLGGECIGSEKRWWEEWWLQRFWVGVVMVATDLSWVWWRQLRRIWGGGDWSVVLRCWHRGVGSGAANKIRSNPLLGYICFWFLLVFPLYTTPLFL